MRTYILRRLVVAIPSLLIASLIVFVLPRLIPGDVVQLMLEEKAYGKDLEDLRAKLGLDRPIPVQYAAWMGKIARGDFGESLWTRRPVIGELARRLPVTLTLGGMAIAVAILIGIPIGIVSAVRQDGVLDFFVLRAERRHPGFVHPGLRAGDRGHPAPRHLVGVDSAPAVRRVVPGSGGVPPPVHPAGDHPRRRLGGGDHAAHSRDAPRGAAAGLRPYGLGQGTPRASGRAQAQPQERHHPGGDGARPAGGAGRGGRRDHRDDLRAAGHGAVPGGFHSSTASRTPSSRW